MGDIVQVLDGRIVKDRDLDALIGSYKPGTKVLISYMRDASSHEAIVTVGKKPVQVIAN